MIKEIPAWRCTVCKKIMVDRTKAEEHEKLPVVEPLPPGFVYFNKDDITYGVVIKKPGKRLEDHDYLQKVAEFDERIRRPYKPRVFFSRTRYKKAGYVRAMLGSESLGRLFSRFEKFRLMYSKLDPKFKREIGLQARDLTNRLK